MKKVKLTKPGIVAVGQYQAGEVYEIEDKEAERLVKVKGFEYVAEAAAPKTQQPAAGG